MYVELNLSTSPSTHDELANVSHCQIALNRAPVRNVDAEIKRANFPVFEDGWNARQIRATESN